VPDAEGYRKHPRYNPEVSVLGQKKKSKRQVRYLLSKASPLKKRSKAKLKKELHTGKVKVGK
jgi:hypothetical protein